MRLIDSFFSPYFSRRRRGPFTDPADRITRHLEYLFVHSVPFVYRRFTCAYVRTCVRVRRGETRFRREKQHHRMEERRIGERKENCLSLSPLSLSFSRILHEERCEGNKMREKRTSCCVFGCICPSLLSPSHARVPIKAPWIRVTQGSFSIIKEFSRKKILPLLIVT